MFWMNARFNSKCAECDEVITTGDRFVYDPKDKKGYCRECGPEILGADPTARDEEF